MIESLRVRFWIIFIVFIAAAVKFLPNVADVSKVSWLPQKKINYGLDIQGGLHLVMGVDVEGSLKEKTLRLSEDLKGQFSEAKIEGVQSVQASSDKGDEITISVSGEQNIGAVKEDLNKNHGGVLQVVDVTGSSLKVRYLDTWLIRYKKDIIDQAIETIRNRIDEFGVSEPSITSQGENRILIQLPGIDDANRAKDLINRTARLDFMLVSEEMKPGELDKLIGEAEAKGGYDLSKIRYSEYVNRINEDLKGKIPEKTAVFFGLAQNAASLEVGKVPYLLTTGSGLSGEDLRDAGITFDEYGAPAVSLSFDPGGAKKFGEITGANVNKQMAIVLDKVVKTAPSIRSRIATGSAQITLGAGGRNRNDLLAEAKLISMALKAGALPASLEQLEERSVGPTLGKDSIEKGKIATVVGAALVFLFMLIWYKGFGILADIALAFNILILLAVLASIGATLTLPGIAGIALTVGMAVDSNVVIFERIREELKKGIPLQAAIREGFDKAFSAVFDANTMTLAVCLILMYYGTGPIRGFAVTLTIGLAASLFTAIFVTRAFLDQVVGKMKINLPI